MTTKTNTPMLEDTLQVAHTNDWRLVRDTTSGPTQDVTLQRGEGESLYLHCWSQHAQGGQGQIRSYTGFVASGQVSRRSVRGEFVRQREIEDLLRSTPPEGYDNNSGYMLAVNEGEHNEHWETASNYTVHRLRPGLYPLELVNINYQRVADPTKAYYAMARVLTDEIRRYYVNRVFTASSAHDETIDPPKPSSISWTAYSYQLEKLHANPGDKFVVVQA